MYAQIKPGEIIYFWWTIVAVFCAAELMLYAFAAFAVGGDERPIQVGFALSVAKVICLAFAAAKASSTRTAYVVASLIASSLLPCFYFGQMIYERASPFSFQWGSADFMLASIVFVDLVQIILCLSRLRQLLAGEPA